MAERPDSDYRAGDIIPFHLSPGIVVASFFVSLTGAITTVELLHRRPNGGGWSNWLHLGACAVSMGLVATWCMHYVGNRAIILGQGAEDLQLVYNSGWTALSSFIPISVLFIAFTIADRRYHGKTHMLLCIVLSGIVAGLACVGMHYTGNLGVSNYDMHFNLCYVGGAIVIACIACVGALTLIFMLQDKWLNILPWRIVCAITIAGAVSGMHFEASMGTTYELRHRVNSTSHSRATNVIIAIVLSLLTIPVCLGIAISTNKRRKQLADRAQQVVLACVRFDGDGRLMVTHEGLLPSQNITEKHNQRSFQDEFKESHPAFQWIFKVSHNWSSVTRWLPQMRQHVQSTNFDNTNNYSKRKETGDQFMWDKNPADEDYSLVFRESFCIAAADLATDLREPVEELGTLYERVMMTGTQGGIQPQCQLSLLQALRMRPPSRDDDSERSIGTDMFGTGQLLFLVKRLTRHAEVSRALALGHRFVHVDKISEHLAKSLRVSIPHLTSYLTKLRTYVERLPGSAPVGTLLGCFVLRAGISRKSWDVLVRRDCQFRLPCVQLSTTELKESELDILAMVDGLSLTNCVAQLNSKRPGDDDYNSEFALLLKERLHQLCEIVKEPFFRQAIFSSRVVKVPTCDPRTNIFSHCGLVAFHILPDVHVSSLKSSPAVTYTPLSFFRCRQQILEGHKHNSSLERRIHHEFAALFAGRGASFAVRPTSSMVQRLSFSAGSKLGAMLRQLAKRRSKESKQSSQNEQVSYRTSSPDSLEARNDLTRDSSLAFGGIMVSSDVTVETTLEDADVETPVKKEGADTGTSGYAGIAEADCLTYVDELYALTVARWQRT